MSKLLLSIFVIALGLVSQSSTFALADSFSPEIENLRQEILILDRTRQEAIKEQGQDQLSEQQKEATQQYITHLNRRITSLCTGLLSSPIGASAVADLPCPHTDTLLPGYQIPAAQTSAEQVDNLNRTLIESLGEFDDMLLDEQQKISSNRSTPTGSYGAQGAGSNGQGEGEGATSGSADNDSQGGQGESPESSTATNDKQQDQQTTSSGQAGAGTGKSASSTGAASGKKPGNTPPLADDDDIVARQLREAAENETDPELKRRLWDEYKKYKKEVN